MASLALESFIDECIRKSVSHGHLPTVFQRMRTDHGTVVAISKLVESSELQSGFLKARELGILDWTLEAAVLRFPDEFSLLSREYAGFRLGNARERKLGSAS